MKTLLKSTTSLVLCLSLATPGLAQAQDAAAPFPCVAPNGQTAGDANALADALAAGGSETPAEGAVVCGPDALAAADAVAAEAAVADQAAADQAAADQAAADQAAADQAAADQAAADQAAADQAAADQAAADQAAADQAAADQAAADQAAADQAAADQAAADQAAADQAAADQAAADQAAADQAAADQAAADQAAADQAAADQAAADQAAADQAAADQAAADQAASDQAAADQAAADQAAATTEAEAATAEEQPAAEAAPAEDAAPAAEVAPEVAETAEPADAPMSDADAAAAAIAAQAEADAATTDDAATAETTEAPAAEAPAEEAPVAEVPAEEAPVAEAPAADAAPADDAAAAETAPEATAADAEIAAPTAQDQATRTAELEAERQNAAAAAAAAALAAGTATEGEAPEIVTEDVTEEDIRTADEDFTTLITGARDAASDDNGDEGLSNFEKALVLGLGAVAVGALLRNGDQVVSNSGDRVIVERDGELRVLKNDDVLLRQPGAQVGTQTFDDGSTLTTVTREDGSVVTTIRAADGTVLRRSLTRTDGTQVALIDDLGTTSVPVEVANLPPVPTERVSSRTVALNDQAALETALTASLLANTGRTYSLEQVRGIREVRALAPQIDLDAITFETGSAAIQPSQAEQLAALGGAIRQIVADNPSAIFLVEGHTDAVGDEGYNLGLSDRRAETVALALSQYFQVPPENLVTQGYGEQFLRIQSAGDERANRRAAVRNITQLLRS